MPNATSTSNKTHAMLAPDEKHSRQLFANVTTMPLSTRPVQLFCKPVEVFDLRAFLAFTALLVFAACSTPALVPPQNTPTMVAPPAPSCAPCPACAVCASVLNPTAETPPDPVAPATIPTPPEPPRGRLEIADWAQLPDWGRDDSSEAFAAFQQSCTELRARAEWREVCTRASEIAGKPSAGIANQFFRQWFTPHRVVNQDESQTGLVTGYYEPLLRGSRTPTAVFKYPIYSAPQDLVTIDLADVYADLKFRRLRGRMVSNKLMPYYDRAEIESPRAPLKGLEIAYVDNAVELFFLQIQGSGQIVLPDGERIRVGYADQNGHPFRSLGGVLIRRGEIRAERASMQGIKEWAKRHPKRLQQYMNANPSYVFFKELPNELSGPIGTLGVPLTAERSIAVDARVIPLGVPVYLSTTFPSSKEALNRLMVAQDTGGAINGAVRADFYWGFGDDAGAQAGKMKQQGRMWVLLPKDYKVDVPESGNLQQTSALPQK